MLHITLALNFFICKYKKEIIIWSLVHVLLENYGLKMPSYLYQILELSSRGKYT